MTQKEISVAFVPDLFRRLENLENGSKETFQGETEYVESTLDVLVELDRLDAVPT